MRSRQVAALKLRMLRIDRGLSQVALAERVGLAANTIARLEAGDIPTPATAFKVASFFEMKPTEMWPDLLKDREERVA